MTTSYREKIQVIADYVDDVKRRDETIAIEMFAYNLQKAANSSMSQYHPDKQRATEELEEAKYKVVSNIQKAAIENANATMRLLEHVRVNLPEKYDYYKANYLPKIKELQENAAYWDYLVKTRSLVDGVHI